MRDIARARLCPALCFIRRGCEAGGRMRSVRGHFRIGAPPRSDRRKTHTANRHSRRAARLEPRHHRHLSTARTRYAPCANRLFFAGVRASQKFYGAQNAPIPSMIDYSRKPWFLRKCRENGAFWREKVNVRASMARGAPPDSQDECTVQALSLSRSRIGAALDVVLRPACDGVAAPSRVAVSRHCLFMWQKIQPLPASCADLACPQVLSAVL